jgi:iron complex transport system substrate-binding protein
VTSQVLANLPYVSTVPSTVSVTVENCGRPLTFQKTPQRVISLWQPSNELLLALGVQKQIIGLAGNYTDLLPEFASAAQAIPSLGKATQFPTRGSGSEAAMSRQIARSLANRAF